MLGQKINKNRSNILHNTTVTTMLQLDSILEATWLHAGRVLGIKLEPKSSKNRTYSRHPEISQPALLTYASMYVELV